MDKDEAQELTSRLLQPGYDVTQSGSFPKDSCRTAPPVCSH